MTPTSSNKSEKKERTYHVAFQGFREERPAKDLVCLYYRILCHVYPHIMEHFIYHPRFHTAAPGVVLPGIVPISGANTCPECRGASITGNLEFSLIFKLAGQLGLATPKMHITTTCKGEVLHANR